MTGPQYVNDLSSLYLRMYNHPGDERSLNEKRAPDFHPNHEVEEDEDPNWKKVLRKHARKQKRHIGPTVADVPRDDIPDAHEDEENQDIGVGSDLVNQYLDALEKKKVIDSGEDDYESQAHEYLKTIINNVPTAAGGKNIHRIIKDAFIAGTKAR